MFVLFVSHGSVIVDNYLQAQVVNIESNCLTANNLPLVNTDGTGRNIFEGGPAKIVWDNTNLRWLIKLHGINMWISNTQSSPNPPTNLSDWAVNAAACNTFTSLAIINDEICDNGLDDDLDMLIDCNDPDCATSGFFLNDNNAFALAGQDDFVSNSSGLSDKKFNGISDVAIDPTTGKVFASDTWNHRVLRYASIYDFITNQPAEAVFGQSNFTTNTQSSGQDKIARPMGIFVDHIGTLWVASYNLSSVVKFNNASSSASGALADGVLGKSDFAGSGGNGGASGMHNPIEVLVDDNGTLWVSDYSNGRVLGFDNANGKSNGAAADRVLGKPDFNTYSGLINQNTTGNVTGLAIINNSLFVSDYSGHRILRWDNVLSKSNGADADAVFGQASFNNSSLGTSCSQFNRPYFLDSDSDNNLYVCDRQNSRILVFDNPISNSYLAPAKFVIGQVDFVSNTVGTQDHELNRPRGVSILEYGGARVMAVADYSNNRMIGWGHSFQTFEITKFSSTLPGVDASGSTMTLAIQEVEIGSVQIHNSTTGEFTYNPPGFCPLNSDSVINVIYQISNSFGCASTDSVKISVQDTIICTSSKTITSCNETFNFDWYDGSSGFVWPISNGAATISNYNSITPLYGGMGVNVSIDNSSGSNIDYANCGTTGNHFYTATCNDPGASADCDGNAGTTDGQITMGCGLLTMGMTSDNVGDEIRLIFDFETPVMISDLTISDLDYEGSSTPEYESWQDNVEIRAFLSGSPVNVQIVAGSKVIVENNFSPQVNVKSIYDPNSDGGLSPSDPDGHATIITEDFVDSIILIMTNGPEDDGLSDDHVIGISSFSFCPKISENTVALCTDGIDNDMDGGTDCNDDNCDSLMICPDFDSDGISNVFDKDDDNDGFSDEQEGLDLIYYESFGWSHNTPEGTSNMDFNQNPAIESWFGQNFSQEQVNNISRTIPGSYAQISGISSSTFEESMINNEYLFFQFETRSGLIEPILTDATCGVFTNANGDSYHVALLISDDSFASYTILSKDVYIDGNPSSYTEYGLNNFGSYRLLENSTYDIRAYVYGMVDTGPGSYGVWDDLFIRVYCGRASDFDIDGYDNHQDLDSDNDGLYDILEGKGPDSDNDGLIGTGAIIDFNTDGWSALCDPWDGGTELLEVISEGIGLPDRINLDSDDDGCNDVIEAGFPDTNADGILGGTPVSTNPNGTVIYTP